jgi:hypothetical protein
MSEEYNVNNLPDTVIIRLYKLDPSPIYPSIILNRYKYFILKVISRWNSCNTYCVKLSQSDFDDVHQYARLAVILFMSRVRNVAKVKNVSVSIKSYIYTLLNKQYRYSKYESPDEKINEHADESIEPPKVDYFDFSITDYDYVLYLRYQYKYNYYKLGLLLTELKDKKSMTEKLSKLIKRRIKRVKWNILRKTPATLR